MLNPFYIIFSSIKKMEKLPAEGNICLSEGIAEPAEQKIFSEQSISLITYLTLFLLYITPRFFQTGHVLAWDEAWNLCALRSLAEGNSIFSLQYWRHPPIYMELGRLLQPLLPGFAERLEILSIILSGAAMLVTVYLVKGILGKRTAVYSGIVWALMPGAVFFETWIKRDPVVALFGMLAWLLLFQNKYLAAGLILGLAFLGKETAVFYVPALALTVLAFRLLKARLALFWLAVGPLIVAGWWFIFMARGGAGFVSFFLGKSLEGRSFSQPGWYYLNKLALYLGRPGLILFLIGLCSAMISCRRSKEKGNNGYMQTMPLLLLFPALAVISLSVGKPAWMLIPLTPALAILCGQGWRRISGFMPVPLSHVLLVLVMTVALSGFHYNRYFKAMSPKQFEHVKISLTTAAMINDNVKDNERLLILPMLYRDGPRMLDPIMYWELRSGMKIIRTLDMEIDYQKLITFIERKKIDWILMSPVDGSDQQDVFNELVEEYNPVGYMEDFVVLLETKNILN
jgi:4-amino-4-deoxy-L-arabinose transferase-like glycosyltransferase